MPGFVNTGAFASASPRNSTSFDAQHGVSADSAGQSPGDASLEQQPGVIEAARIDRPVRVAPQDEVNNTPGVPFAPPDPLANDFDDDEAPVQVIELDDKNSDDGRGHDKLTNFDVQETRREDGTVVRKRVDPVSELTARDYVYYLFEGFPSKLYRRRTLQWVRAAEVVNNFILFIVLVSCFSFAAETLPEYYDRDLLTFTIIEAICIGIFTIDFVVRVVLTRERLKFIKSPQNWIDFVSIVPFYVTLMIGADSQSASGFVMLRMLRLMRVFRILKLSKRNVGLQAVVEAMLQSSEAISLLTFLLMIATVLFSSAMFFAEQTGSTFDEERELWIRDNGQVSPFQSIFHTMWWCIVTMTTVGYGDDVPVTPLGKVIGSITMLCGVFVLAFPTVILSTNFQEVHQAKVDQHKQMREELEEIEAEADDEHDFEESEEDDGLYQLAAGQQEASLEAESTMFCATQRIDPRFEALVEKLQRDFTKYTRFKFTYNPYTQPQSKPSRIRRKVSALATPSGNVLTVPSSTAQANPLGTSEALNPDSFGSKRNSMGAVEMTARPSANTPAEADPAGSVAVPVPQASLDKPVEGQILIVDNEVAVFTPALYFAATESNHLHARVEAVAETEQQVLTLMLVIDTEGCREVVEESLKKHRPDESFIPVGRPLKKLQLKIETTHALLRGVKLVTSIFDDPTGVVPVTLLVPNPSVLSILIGNLGNVKFNMRCFYDEPATIVEPLVRYGGVLLTGDAFDNDDELQLYVAEEDDRQQQQIKLHGATSNVGRLARRGSNHIVPTAGSGSSSGAALSPSAGTVGPGVPPLSTGGDEMGEAVFSSPASPASPGHDDAKLRRDDTAAPLEEGR